MQLASRAGSPVRIAKPRGPVLGSSGRLRCRVCRGVSTSAELLVRGSFASKRGGRRQTAGERYPQHEITATGPVRERGRAQAAAARHVGGAALSTDARVTAGGLERLGLRRGSSVIPARRSTPRRRLTAMSSRRRSTARSPEIFREDGSLSTRAERSASWDRAYDP